MTEEDSEFFQELRDILTEEDLHGNIRSLGLRKHQGDFP